MTGRSDITRWNRAGLRRFQYVDANAATYLEELRVRLADRFPLWQPIQRTSTGRAVPPAAFGGPRLGLGDRAVVGARVPCARRARRRIRQRVLPRHRDPVGEPAPPGCTGRLPSAPLVSAVTNLVLVAKPGASGTVPPGFAVSAATPGAQITFETMEELAIEHRPQRAQAAGLRSQPRHPDRQHARA